MFEGVVFLRKYVFSDKIDSSASSANQSLQTSVSDVRSVSGQVPVSPNVSYQQNLMQGSSDVKPYVYIPAEMPQITQAAGQSKSRSSSFASTALLIVSLLQIGSMFFSHIAGQGSFSGYNFRNYDFSDYTFSDVVPLSNDDTSVIQTMGADSDRRLLSQRYQHMSEQEKSAYHELTYVLREHLTSYEMKQPCTVDVLARVYTEMTYLDEYYMCIFTPSELYADVGYAVRNDQVTDLNVTYTYTKEQADDIYQRTMQEAEKLVQQADGMTQYEAEKFYHDTLARRVTYDQTHKRTFCHAAAGALLEGSCVCDGYAKAFYLLCHLSGIPCDVVSGFGTKTDTAEEERHAWNLVCLDGEYYAVDCTWDDFDVDYYVAYSNFNMSSEEEAARHTRDETYSANLPEADGTVYSYANMTGYVANDENTFLSVCNMQIDQIRSGVQDGLFVLIPNEALYQDVVHVGSSVSKVHALAYEKGLYAANVHILTNGDHGVVLYFS